MKSILLSLRSIVCLFFSLLVTSVCLAEEKSIYVPRHYADVNNPESQWCMERSLESENFIVFWEAGYGSDPRTVSDTNYRVNLDALLDIAERSYAYYADSLKFIVRGRSKADTYKMIIQLRYTRDWEATGSGVDNTIGLLTLTAWSGQALGSTVAHEVGHCFQFQSGADDWPGGFNYGLGENGVGGNGFWEQCAQWQAWQLFPEEQFGGRFNEYLNAAHLHLLHEAPRYANYFIQDYWSYLHGTDFLGTLWRMSRSPEDPIEAYQRLTLLNHDDTQAAFNDEIYDCAARLATWDIPAIRERGKNHIGAHPQCQMTLTDDGYWLVDSAHCIESYGYNLIKLNVPAEATTLTAYFNDETKATGYRSFLKTSTNRKKAGWRYGFVALLKNGERVYGDMGRLNGSIKPKSDTLTFECPDNCERLWFVVTGAPNVHIKHEWDDNASNDEQWPYSVKFDNTNLYGHYHFDEDAVPHDTTMVKDLYLAPVASGYPSTNVSIDLRALCEAFCLSYTDIKSLYNTKITYAAIQPNNSIHTTSTANAPGHWFAGNGSVVNYYDSSSTVFSELNTGSLSFNIGQYPGRCRLGDTYTIRQCLIYRSPQGKTVRAIFQFNITIGEAPTAVLEMQDKKTPLIQSVQRNTLQLCSPQPHLVIYNTDGRIMQQAYHTQQVDIRHLPSGIYIVRTHEGQAKFYKP